MTKTESVVTNNGLKGPIWAYRTKIGPVRDQYGACKGQYGARSHLLHNCNFANFCISWPMVMRLTPSCSAFETEHFDVKLVKMSQVLGKIW